MTREETLNLLKECLSVELQAEECTTGFYPRITIRVAVKVNGETVSSSEETVLVPGPSSLQGNW